MYCAGVTTKKQHKGHRPLSDIWIMVPQTTEVTGEHCRSVLGNDRGWSVLGNDRSWSRSILGAAGQWKQERDKKMPSVRWHKGVTHDVRNNAVE